jgi:hypothetical protein
MQYTYVITLKYSNFKAVNLISQIMLALSVIIFIAIALYYPDYASLYWVFSAAIVLYTTYCILAGKRKKRIVYYRLALFIAAIGWFATPLHNIWLSLLYLIAGLIEQQIKFPAEVGVNEQGITLNTFPKKKYEWKEINNMIIKDDLLTIDFKNNKIFQKELEENTDNSLIEELNNYCAAHLPNNKNEISFSQ